MTPQEEAVNAVISELSSIGGYGITIGALPINGGVSAEITGGTDSRYIDKEHGINEITVLFICKNASQAEAYRRVTEICNYLAAMPTKELSKVSVLGAKIRGMPQLAENEHGYYIYSAVAGIMIGF